MARTRGEDALNERSEKLIARTYHAKLGVIRISALSEQLIRGCLRFELENSVICINLIDACLAAFRFGLEFLAGRIYHPAALAPRSIHGMPDQGHSSSRWRESEAHDQTSPDRGCDKPANHQKIDLSR